MDKANLLITLCLQTNIKLAQVSASLLTKPFTKNSIKQQENIMTEYVIMGRSEYGTEEVDTADTRAEAKRLAGEYRLAFGAGWSISVKSRRIKG